MHNVSGNFVKAMEYAPYIARITLDGTDVIQGGMVQKIHFIGGTNADDEAIAIGDAVAGSIEITLDKEQVVCAVVGREIFVELGIELDSGIEWLPMGTYTITETAEDDGNLIVSASDALYAKFDVEYEDVDGFDFDAESGVDSLEFVKAICTRRGVEVDVSELEAVPLKYSPTGYTERQILGFIGALYGRFADIDRYGKLTFRWYENADRTVDADLYYSGAMTKASNDFTVQWLKCYAAPLEETLICGDEAAEQGIYFECPWMDQGRLEVIWEKLKNFTYRPITELKFFGDPRIDPGDVITLVDLAGSVHSVPVMSINHEYDGGVTTEISAPGQSTTEETEGPVTRETKRLYSQIIKKQSEIELSIKSIDGDKIVSLINMTETEILIQASKIKLEGLVTANSNFMILEDGSIEAVNAKISGAITATSLTLGTNVSIPTGNIKGLSTVATSGKYADLIDAPAIPTSVADLGLDTSKIIFKGDITQTTKTDSNGISYRETTVPTSSGGKITYSTYDAENYIVFGRSKGTNADGSNYVCISKDGLLTARNALIYGTVYATDGEFTGKVTAKSGTIGGCIIEDGVLKVTSANITGTLTADRIKVYKTSGALLFSAGDNAVEIGGWDVDSNSIYKTTGSWGAGTFMCTGSTGSYSIGGSGTISGWVFGAGGKFGVTSAGAVYCSDIHATGGNIGGWTVDGSRLTGTDSYGYAVTLTPGGIVCYKEDASGLITSQLVKWRDIASAVLG